jgi:tRNA pseudouridine55 synthase
VASRTQSRPQPPPLDPAGILLVDKPAGMTSHDVVDRVRRRFGYRKVGHAGTLDPMATGVLVLLIGNATRAQGRFLEHDKTYVGTLRLGSATTTHDREGEVTDEAPVPAALDRAALEAALARFIGPIEQVPPMVSAVKHRGRPLYKYARQGIEVAREARRVTIHALALLDFDPARAEARFEVRCSKGTYVRTLAHDLGRALGTFAHLTELRRTRSGPFGESDCMRLDALLESRAEEVPYLLKLVSEVAGEAPGDDGERADGAASERATYRAEEGA